MILYTEEQLEIAYTEYRKLHMRKDVPFLKKEAENKKTLTYSDIKKIILKVK